MDRDVAAMHARNPDRASRAFAWYSVVFAAVHLTGEMVYHFRYGQPLPGLIVDYIAVSLLCLGVWLLLARGWHAGVLCGAWGFELCLTYRSFFWRMAEIAEGTASDVTRSTAYVLGGLLLLALVSFAYSMWLCRPAGARAMTTSDYETSHSGALP